MEHNAKGFAAIVQLLPDPPVHDPPTQPTVGQQLPPHQPVQRRTEVVCPLPVRSVRTPCLVDNANGVVFCTTTPKLGFRDTFQRQQELLDFLLGQDDADDGRYFFGTPPARTGNPIVNDAEFRKLSFASVGAVNILPTVNHASPYYPTPTEPSPRGDRAKSDSPSSFTSVPSIRVQGFPSPAGSARRRIISAIA